MRTAALRTTHPLAHTFVRAAADSGLPVNDDYNGAVQEGVAYSEVNQQRGQRYSAARAYLHPVRHRPNLEIRSRSVCRRLVIENGRCVGVEYAKGAELHRDYARCEVILSAGAIASPKLLMLSGIGPAGPLRQAGINVVQDLPGVGANLQEHPEGMVGIDVNLSTYNTEINSWKIILHGLNWLLFGRGPASDNARRRFANDFRPAWNRTGENTNINLEACHAAPFRLTSQPPESIAGWRLPCCCFGLAHHRQVPRGDRLRLVRPQ